MRKRSIVETVIGQLKTKFRLVPHPPSFNNKLLWTPSISANSLFDTIDETVSKSLKKQFLNDYLLVHLSK